MIHTTEPVDIFAISSVVRPAEVQLTNRAQPKLISIARSAAEQRQPFPLRASRHNVDIQSV